MTTTEYPLDTSTLTKGDRISIEVIERSFNVRFGTSAYQLAMLKATEYVRRRLLERGERVTIAQQKGALVILNDPEAAKYTEVGFWTGLRRSRRMHDEKSAVDRSNLPANDLERHDRTLTVQGGILSAIRKARRALTLKATERATPVLPGAKGDAPP